jgi:hypothetical protein
MLTSNGGIEGDVDFFSAAQTDGDGFYFFDDP